MKRWNKAKKLVMKPLFRMKVEKDKTKYTRKRKHKDEKVSDSW